MPSREEGQMLDQRQKSEPLDDHELEELEELIEEATEWEVFERDDRDDAVAEGVEPRPRDARLGPPPGESGG
jgi:hypothetical protein